MRLTDKLNTPGEHTFLFPGVVGQLEITLTVPENPDTRYIALLGHPHSLQGGSMNNKVVTTLARAFKDLHIPNLRFNFRGVGNSAGCFDKGLGESEDMLFLASCCLKEQPHIKFLFAGFSFGSYVAYRAAAHFPHVLLITVAPAVLNFDYTEFSAPQPWVVLQGDDDEVVPLQAVLDFVALSPSISKVLRFPATGHFFHGKLIDLRACIKEVTHELIGSVDTRAS